MAPGLLLDDSDGIHNNASGVHGVVDSNLPASSPYSLETSENHYDCLGREKFEPIAVIGFSLKFPQGATSPEAFWEMLTEKRCSMTEWPKDRLNVDAFYHADSNRPDTIPFRGGHFLEEPLGNFDAPFFSITSAEAAAIDPQHRLLLETAYRALENAGISLEKVSGSKTSVHTGCFTDDYKMAVLKDTDLLPTYTCTGVAVSMLAARLSWFFNLTGPCVNLDSACSSSMMAFDLACQGLRNLDSNMALVGGANIAFALEYSLPLSNMNFVSRDSRSFSFDSRANGYGRGEGFGVIILKRLTDALKDGDTIRAVVRSTGSNQDGRTPGITQPSGDAQELLIRETYEKAGLDMKATRFVEAHGTGTAVGDPIEASAIGRAFRKYRSAEEPMYIGAVKSNIGHLEGASGVAGIIKTIMILETAVIPPNANFERMNPSIDAEFLRITFPLHSTPWPSRGLRRASISSFGFGGSNSHAILDDAYNFLRIRGLTGNHWAAKEPPALEPLEQSFNISKPAASMQNPSQRNKNGDYDEMSPKLLVWSAADEGGLARLAKVYGAHVSHLASSSRADEASTYLESLAYTLAARRSSLSWKAFAVARSVSDLQDLRLKLSKPVRSKVMPRLGYIFTGQGAQFAGMSKELIVFPVFVNSLRRSEMYLDQLGCRWSLLGELMKDTTTSNINGPAYSQPLCTALQIALVDLFRAFKIDPSVVVGHSSGEIAAAYCVGGLSHQSACKVAFFRGQYAAKLAESGQHRGAMISVGLSEEELDPYFKQLTLQFGHCAVIVGCINSPKNVTVSGDETQVDMLKSLLDKDIIFARRLQVSVAYHSPHMDVIAADYFLSIQGLEQDNRPTSSSIMMSSVTGKILSPDEMHQSEYWVKNMTSPVRFSDALSRICSAAAEKSKKKLGADRATISIDDLLEVGPHNALQGPTKDVLRALDRKDISYGSVLVRSLSATETLLSTVGRLHCAGYAFDISEVNGSGRKIGDRQMVLPDLPGYPFDHSRSYWHESRFSKEGRRLRKHPRMDLLGSPVMDWNVLDARWRNILRASEMPWIMDHKINGVIIYPAAGLLVMALEASKQLADNNRRIAGYTIRDATFHSPLAIPENANGVEAQLNVRPLGESSEKDSMTSEFKVSVYIDGHWNETCRGTILLEYEVPETEVDLGKEAKGRLLHYRRLFEKGVCNCDRTVGVKRMYEHMQDVGLGYGPTFQALEQISYSVHGEATGRVRAFQWSAHENTNHPQCHIVHPTTLDALLQLMLVALSRGAEENIPTVMPTRIGKLWISGSGISYPSTSAVNVYAQAAFSGIRKADAFMFAVNQTTGDLLLSIEKVEATTVATRDALSQSQSGGKKLCYDLAWKPDLELLDDQQALTYCESARPARASAAEFYEGLNFVLMMFMSDTLDALAEVTHKSSQSHLRYYVQWLRHQVDRFHAGDLPNLADDNPKWTSLVQDKEYREALCNYVESTNQGKFFVKIGRNLLKILKGDLDPLAFLFQDDSIPEFYKEINRDVICYEPLYRYLEALSHKKPGLKILEIGAGTGATTDFVLDALGNHEGTDANTLNCAQYDYTDISPAFFETAAGRYGRHGGRLRFKVLDIEVDPSKQGFETGTYDLIIAASVLHATKNLEVTMLNTRTLLKPGGKLVIFEVTQDVIRARFAFGLLPGWWLSQEDYRRWGPCISIKEWHDLLSRTGFSGANLNIPDYREEVSHEYSIIISTAGESQLVPKRNPSPDRLHFPKTLIIVTKGSTIQENTASELKDNFTCNGNTDCQIVSLKQAYTTGDINQRFCFFLIETEQPFLYNLSADTFAMLQHVLLNVPGLLWVTNGGGKLRDKPLFHLVDGLARVARTEYNKLVFVTLALENVVSGRGTHVGMILQAFDSTMSHSVDDFESEYIEKDGMLEIGRVMESCHLNQSIHVKTKSNQSMMQSFGHGPPLALHIGSPGLLDSLHFLEDIVPTQPLAPGELEIKVEATGVNFRDCLTALGQIDTKLLGVECSGVVSRIGAGCEFNLGDRVASCFINTYRTYARGPEQCVHKIPDDMSYPEASALPVVFITAWYALCDLARLQRGESVLIHAGAGGTGQAAIQVAKHLGAEIYVTVGSDHKKKLLMNVYGIPEDHILYSRNTSFAQGIMRMTDNRGVDVILNSLSGEGLLASWECIAPFGRFIEIGKRDINSHGVLPMWPFHKNATFSSVDFYPAIKERPSIVHKAFTSVMALITDKKLHLPQPFRVFGVSEIETALRLFQSGSNSGKMAIEMRKNDLVRTVLNMKPEYRFEEKSSYLIAGGLGGLGRSAARWMARRGAKNLILLSRSGARSEAALALLEELKATGVQVRAPVCDVTVADSLSAVLANCGKDMPPVKGVIQASMVLRDAILEKMTFEDWKLSIEAKVQGSWNLHTLLPQGMDFFVCFSSISGIVGSGGQANYAAANTYMDALAQYRIMRGEKATALDLGWMRSEGVVAESLFLSTGLTAKGDLLPISQADFYALLGHYCNPTLEVAQSLASQAIIGLEIPAAMRAKGLKPPHWMQRRTFRHLHEMDPGGPSSAQSEKAIDYNALIRDASSLEDAGRIVIEGLVRKLSKALSIPKEDMDTSKPLHAYGVDSLLAVELRNYFAKELEADVAIFDIMGGASFETVGVTVARKSRFRLTPWTNMES